MVEPANSSTGITTMSNMDQIHSQHANVDNSTSDVTSLAMSMSAKVASSDAVATDQWRGAVAAFITREMACSRMPQSRRPVKRNRAMVSNSIPSQKLAL